RHAEYVGAQHAAPLQSRKPRRSCNRSTRLSSFMPPGPAFLFDLDGTLVDSVYQHVLAWREALESVGIELSVWRIHRRIGMSGGLFVNALFRETGRDLKPEHAKPDPDLFLAGAERLGIPIDESVVVGDSVWDLLAARRARALGVGLLSGGYGEEELERAGAYRVYQDPADLLNHLDEVGVRIGSTPP